MLKWADDGKFVVILVFSKLMLSVTKFSASFGSSRNCLLRNWLSITWVSNEVSKYNFLEFDACNLTPMPCTRQFILHQRLNFVPD